MKPTTWSGEVMPAFFLLHRIQFVVEIIFTLGFESFSNERV